jgi:hypothetical protein
MRRIGHLKDQAQAQRFVDFLYGEGRVWGYIAAHLATRR